MPKAFHLAPYPLIKTSVVCTMLLVFTLIVPAQAKRHTQHLHWTSVGAIRTDATAAPGMGTSFATGPIRSAGSGTTEIPGVCSTPIQEIWNAPAEIQHPWDEQPPRLSPSRSAGTSLAKLILVSLTGMILLPWFNRARHRKAVAALREGACLRDVNRWLRGWQFGSGLAGGVWLVVVTLVIAAWIANDANYAKSILYEEPQQ
jgi:hypothetical protein